MSRNLCHSEGAQRPKSLAPKLRFPEFLESGEWEEKRLDEIASFHKGKNISKADIDSQGETPCIRYGELYTIYGEVIDKVFSKTKLPATELFLSKKYDVLIPSSGETKIDIARASCVLLDDIALGADLNILRTKENGIFLSYLINNPYKTEIAKKAQGDTVVHLYASQLEPMKVLTPDLPEQQKIADCLTSLDELIAAERAQLDALKDYKKGLLQNLFPAEGELVPKLRFPEFQSAGDWEEEKLGNVSVFVNERISLEKLTLDNYISTENILPDYGGVTRASKLPPSGSAIQFKINDILISNIRPYLKKVWFSNKDGGASNDVIVVRAKENIDTKYLAFILKNDSFIEYVMEGAKGVKMPRGDISLMKEYPLAYPSIQEQQKIAEMLTSIDEEIAAQGQRVATLGVHKQGLLQGLFPSA